MYKLKIMNFKIVLNRYNFFLSVCSVLLLNISCSKEQSLTNSPSISTPNSIKITNLSIPNEIEISSSSLIQIGGQGFLATDTIIFVNKDNNKDKVNLTIASASENGITLDYEETLTTNAYTIFLLRNGYHQQLGFTVVKKVFNPNIPDIANMTIKGVVYSQGQGLANVIVSDGEVFAKTDQNGIYYLPSTKKNGYVFVSIPSNYDVKVKETIPQFYKTLNKPSTENEIIDFELFPTNNENHIVAFFTDTHLANRNEDLQQFREGFLKDITETYKTYKSQNKKFYAFTLGDQSWETYWYDNNFKLKEYLSQIKDLEFPIYNTIGNHDYNPYIGNNDWLASAEYRNIMGPTYYSLNIGKVHYIVLDNVVYTNAGGATGIIGDREYETVLSQEQLDWLKKDLAYITDKSTPIVIAMHVPLYASPTSSSTFSTQNGQQIVDALASFGNVKFMSGHTHINYRVNREESNHIAEQNIAAVSATWWWTGRSGYANNQICKDGSPAGYVLWEMNAKNQQSIYKSIGHNRNYQFRTYDLNTVHITDQAHTPNANATYKAKVPSYAGEYATARNNNQVMINIWAYNKNWKITVAENGKNLAVTQTNKKDPLHIISYAMKRLNVNADPTSSFTSSNTNHLFLVNANSATSTLEITVEDEYGNIYRETMVRPKAFSTTIY